MAWTLEPCQPRRASSSSSRHNHQIDQVPASSFERLVVVDVDDETPVYHSRRRALQTVAAALVASSSVVVVASPPPVQAAAADEASSSTTTATAEITDKIFVNVKGIPGTDGEPRRIVIGLFGKNAPASVAKLVALASPDGLAAPCRPRAERALQKEQLEANKVYNSCLGGLDEGVSLAYSQVWRIVRDEKIDLGAVTGKFVAREYPDWQEQEGASNSGALKHDAPGVVSVRRGNEGGFGFTIYPGSGTMPSSSLDEEHIVVGRVVQGLDIVEALNQVPVVQSSKVNYMALTGGTTTKNAPSRACRYGGPMYCNEFKPLVKLSITQTGVL